MKNPVRQDQFGLSLVECLAALHLLLVGMLCLGPLLYAGFAARSRAEVRQDAFRKVLDRQEMNRAALLLSGGCPGLPASGREEVVIAGKRCVLRWKSGAPSLPLPSTSPLALMELEAAVHCPADAGRPVCALTELAACRRR